MSRRQYANSAGTIAAVVQLIKVYDIEVYDEVYDMLNIEVARFCTVIHSLPWQNIIYFLLVLFIYIFFSSSLPSFLSHSFLPSNSQQFLNCWEWKSSWNCCLLFDCDAQSLIKREKFLTFELWTRTRTKAKEGRNGNERLGEEGSRKRWGKSSGGAAAINTREQQIEDRKWNICVDIARNMFLHVFSGAVLRATCCATARSTCRRCAYVCVGFNSVWFRSEGSSPFVKSS